MSSQRDNGSEAGAGLREDPLFAALTRPSTVFGITVDVFAFIVTFEMALFMFTKNVTVFASGLALYGIARAMSVKDPRFFRYYLLALQTKWRGQTRRRWGGSSYSTHPTRKRSKP